MKGEPCENCGTRLVLVDMSAIGDRKFWAEVVYDDGRTQRMREHTPARCRELRAGA